MKLGKTRTTATPFVTPLRYPGGKGRLAQAVADIVRLNGLEGGHYAEPYAGGAAVAISLLMIDRMSHAHINDLNRSVHAFWSAVLMDTDRLCSRIMSKRVSMAEWHRQRDVQDDVDADPLDLAFSTFFLNRANRSGIILGGVIGGKHQSGAWRLNARYNKKNLIQRIENIAMLRDKITLYQMDANDMLKNVISLLPESSLVYLDPPYFVKGRGLYQDHYNPADHAVIAETVGKLKQSWIVSYDNVCEIRYLYSKFRSRSFGLNYSAQSRYRGAEIMFFADGMKVPRSIVPSRAKAT